MTENSDTDIIEVTIRRFFTCDECDLAPSVSIVGKASEIAKVEDWNKVILAQSALANDQLKDIPLDGVRPMNAEEIKTFRKAESEEKDSVCYTQSLLDH